MRIKSKLFALFAIPILALVAAGFVGFRNQNIAATEANTALDQVAVTQAVHRASNAIAVERLSRLQFGADNVLIRSNTNEAVNALSSDSYDFPAEQLDLAVAAIAAGRQFDSPWIAAPNYSQAIQTLTSEIDGQASNVKDGEVFTNLLVSIATNRSLEARDLAWISYFADEQFSQPNIVQVSSIFAGADTAQLNAVELATGEDRARLEAALSSPEVVALAEAQARAIAGLQVGEFNITSDSISLTLDGRNTIAAAGAQHDAAMVADAQAIVDQTEANQQLFGLLAALAAVVIAGLLFVIYRSIANPIADLVERADYVANTQLPAVVSRLRSGDALDIPDPPKIKARANDEIGEVVEAFNAMQTTAHSLAVEQAISRRNVADMFVNLGRRNQQLVQRMIGKVSELERHEDDPQALEQLFALDHMVTRMRRNAESLLVLAGSQPPRQWAKPVSIERAVRGSLTEVEKYQRIQINPMDEALVEGSVVVDITHLLAEVLENAVSFSDPTTSVLIDGQLTPTGYLLSVTDYGIGMSEAELFENNQRLHNPPQLDLAPTRFLGLFVVGRLADRHNIHVTLVPGARQGTVVRIEIPNEILALEDDVVIDAPVAEQPLPSFDPTPVHDTMPALDISDVPSSLEGFDDLPAPVVTESPVPQPFEQAPTTPDFEPQLPAREPVAQISADDLWDDEPELPTRGAPQVSAQPAPIQAAEPRIIAPVATQTAPVKPAVVQAPAPQPTVDPELGIERRRVIGEGPRSFADDAPVQHPVAHPPAGQPPIAQPPAAQPQIAQPQATPAPMPNPAPQGLAPAPGTLPTRTPSDSSLPTRQPGARIAPAPTPEPRPVAPVDSEQTATGFSSMMSAFSSGVNKGIQDSEFNNEGNTP